MDSPAWARLGSALSEQRFVMQTADIMFSQGRRGSFNGNYKLDLFDLQLSIELLTGLTYSQLLQYEAPSATQAWESTQRTGQVYFSAGRSR